MAKDLVCGMEVDENNPPAKTEYKGKEYYFCTPLCKVQFESSPEKYIQEDNFVKRVHKGRGNPRSK
jgi:YHS domain-containing protein